MKRLLITTTKALIALSLLIILLFSGFRAVEHVTGNRFISYLKENHESVSLDESFTFEIVDKDISKHDLILVGEIHGFQEPTKIEPEFFEYLNHMHGVSEYLIEMDISQAYYMNKYNETGDEDLLNKVLKNWVVEIGRENEDYRKKWKKLREVYLYGSGFVYHGNNNISDVELLKDYINELAKSNIQLPNDNSDSLNLIILNQALASIDWPNHLSWEAEYISKNIEYSLDNKYREEILTENLVDIYKHRRLSGKKVFGYYGLGHTMLAPVEGGYEAMASRFATQYPEMMGRILSFNFIFTDSFMTVYSKNQPEFLRDEGKYTAFPVSHDNIWLSYLHGIEDLKRVTKKNSKTIFKLNGTESPYNQKRRLMKMSKILPFGMVINGDEGKVTTDYNQYLILVRNSAGAKGL